MSSRYLAEKPWFTVREERVQLPNGNEIPNYYVFEYPDWVNVIAVTRDGKFVFERQYRHAVGLVSYELCAGVCEPDDASPLESTRRELHLEPTEDIAVELLSLEEVRALLDCNGVLQALHAAPLWKYISMLSEGKI